MSTGRWPKGYASWGMTSQSFQTETIGKVIHGTLTYDEGA